MSAPCYPPGVLQTVTIPDLTSPDGGVLELTFIPTRGVTDINTFSAEGISHMREMLESADKERLNIIDSKIEAVQYCMKMQKLSNNAWEFNEHGSHCQGPGGINIHKGMMCGGQRSWNWCQYRHEYTIKTYDSSDIGAIGCPSDYIYDYYCAPMHYDVELVLDLAEEDWEYEQWLKEVDELIMISNLNAAQCRDPEERTGSNALTLNGRIWKNKTGWCGEVVERMGDSVDNMMSEWKKLGRCMTEIKHVQQGQIGHVLLKDRYKVHAKILENNFAETPYGIAWFPPKFANFIPEVGNYCFLTITKNSGEKLTRHRAQFTVIFHHNNHNTDANGCAPAFR